MEKVRIKSGKHKLSAVIHYPKAKERKKLAILLPGFVDSKDYHHFLRWGKELAQRGYVVVRFDPTGTWESEGDIQEYTTSKYLEDIDSVLFYMEKRMKKPLEKVVLLGHSLGGMVAILFGAKDKRVSTVIVSMAPYSYVGTKYIREKVAGWEKTGFRYSKRELPGKRGKFVEYKVPFTFVEDSLRYDVREVISSFHKPALFLAGELDDKVNPEDVRSFYEKAKGYKKFVLIKGVGHDYRHNAKETTRVSRPIYRFLEQTEKLKFQ